MPLTVNATLVILKYVFDTIDPSVQQVFREKGDDWHVKCFFLLIEDYVKSNPEDADLSLFDFDRFTTSILRSESSNIKHRTLADIAAQAISSLVLTNKKAIKWSNKITRYVIDIVNHSRPDEWEKRVEFKSIIAGLKELDQVDYQLALVLRHLVSLGERVVGAHPEDGLLKKGIAKIMLGPCLKNFLFNSNEKSAREILGDSVLVSHSKLYQFFNLVALSILSDDKSFRLSGDVDFTDEQLCHLVSEGAIAPLSRYFDWRPERVNAASGVINQSLLHIAVMKNHVEIVKLLLSHKADMNAMDTLGNRPIDFVSRVSTNASVTFLKKMMENVQLAGNEPLRENKI